MAIVDTIVDIVFTLVSGYRSPNSPPALRRNATGCKSRYCRYARFDPDLHLDAPGEVHGLSMKLTAPSIRTARSRPFRW